MSAELAAFYDSGKTVYVRLFDQSTGYVWNGTTTEAWSNANVGTYDVALTESGASGYYRATPPTLPSGFWDYSAYEQLAASPAITDPQIPGSSKTIRSDGSTVTASSQSGNHRTIGDLLQTLAVSARNAGVKTADFSDTAPNPYGLTEAHLAVRDALDDFIRQTRVTKQTNLAATSDGVDTIEFG